MQDLRWLQKSIGVALGIVFLACVTLPGSVSAEDEVQALKQQLEQMSKEMKSVQRKLEDLETQEQAKQEDIEEIDKRLNNATLPQIQQAIGNMAISGMIPPNGDQIAQRAKPGHRRSAGRLYQPDLTVVVKALSAQGQ